MSFNEQIDSTEHDKDEMEKKKPKPFRYVSYENNSESELTKDEELSHTVMKTEKRTIEVNTENSFILGNDENAWKVDDIIKKHKETRKRFEE